MVVEGNFLVTAAHIRPMNDRAFFGWLVRTIRRRLSAASVRKLAGSMRAVRTEYIQGGVVMIYRDGNGAEAKMLMRRVGNEWLVDETPFSGGTPAQSNPNQR